MKTLFVYGTLCFSEIIEKLTGKSFRTEKAVLMGYRRRKVKGADYPAIIESTNSEVEGILLWDVDDRSMKILSFYEGQEYICKELTVIVRDNPVNAKVFVWDSDKNALDKVDWNLEWFIENSLNIYVEKIIPETILKFNQE